jgi:hypothetical protein
MHAKVIPWLIPLTYEIGLKHIVVSNLSIYIISIYGRCPHLYLYLYKRYTLLPSEIVSP